MITMEASNFLITLVVYSAFLIQDGSAEDLCVFEAMFPGATDGCFTEEEIKLKENDCSSVDAATARTDQAGDTEPTTPEEDVTTDLPNPADAATGPTDRTSNTEPTTPEEDVTSELPDSADAATGPTDRTSDPEPTTPGEDVTTELPDSADAATGPTDRTSDPEPTTPEEDVTTELPDSAESNVTQCLNNMVYGNCNGCIATCADPSGTVDCSNDCTDSPQTCICPRNYLMNGTNCVRQDQCGCYKQGYGVIAEGKSHHVTSDCSEKCTCNSGSVICVASPCAQEATCELVDGVSDCVCNEGYAGDGRTCTEIAFRDCYDISQRMSGDTGSGDYTISPPGWTGEAFTVNCNMTIDGGGWTVIERSYLRSSGQDFNQGWMAYKNGFGTPSGELWIGNEKLFSLTNQGEYELRIDMVNIELASYYAKYDSFRIAGESDKYQLVDLGSFTGTAGFDAMKDPGSHNLENMYFSTPDQDNDGNTGSWCSGHCAACDGYLCGWWFNSCAQFVPNSRHPDSVGFWVHLPDDSGALIYTEMKIRPLP